MTFTSPAFFAQLGRRSLDLILPPLCLKCEAPVARIDTLCPACWKQIHFLAPPYCHGCGAPFDVLPAHDAPAASLLCGKCIATPPRYTTARAAMLYDEASKDLVLGFKHGDRTYLTRALGQWLCQAGQEFLPAADCLIPVPLHRHRLFQRRYNQAALLARVVGRLTHKPVLSQALQRRRATPSQGHMNRAERQKNVHGAFGVNPRLSSQLTGKTVVLVDDVLTTGATVEECAKILIEGGATAVHVLTLARVRGGG